MHKKLKHNNINGDKIQVYTHDGYKMIARLLNPEEVTSEYTDNYEQCKADLIKIINKRLHEYK